MEVVAASLIIGLVLPALIQSRVALKRLDGSTQDRSYASHVSQVVVETMHYRLYNGYRHTASDARSHVDARGYKLNDRVLDRVAAQQRDSPLAFFNGLSHSLMPVAADQPAAMSPYFAPFREASAEDSRALAEHQVGILVFLHEDDAPLPPRLTKERVEPVVDMATIEVSVSWPGPGSAPGARVTRQYVTRLSRSLFESDLTGKKVP